LFKKKSILHWAFAKQEEHRRSKHGIKKKGRVLNIREERKKKDKNAEEKGETRS